MSGLMSFQSSSPAAQQIGARGAREARASRPCRRTGCHSHKETAPPTDENSARLEVLPPRVHDAKSSEITSCVLAPRASRHLPDRPGEEARPRKMPVLSAKKQKMSRAMNWLSSARRASRSPILVVLQQLDIEFVEPAGRLDVDRIVRDLAAPSKCLRAAGRSRSAWRIPGKGSRPYRRAPSPRPEARRRPSRARISLSPPSFWGSPATP